MRISIKLRLLVSFIGLGVVPLLLAGMFMAWQSYNAQKDQAVAFQREVGQRIGDQTKALIEKAEAQLIVVSNDAHFHAEGRGHQKSFLAAVLSSNRVFEELALVDPNGSVVIQISRISQTTSEQLSDRFRSDGILVPSTINSAYYGPVRISESTGEPSMTIGVPIVDKRTGAADWYLVGIVRLKVVWELIGQIHVGEGGIAYIIDDKNRVIAHRNPSVVLRGTEFYPPDQDGFASGMNGDRVVISSQEFSIGRRIFQVVTEKPVSEAMALTIRSGISTAIIFLGALLVSGALATIAIRFIVRPINHLATVARAFEAGDLAQRVEVTTNDELGSLGAAFNAMGDRLSVTVDSLAYHVAELEHEAALREIAEQNLETQTQELARSNQELEQFAHLASHDLQEPLRMVSSYTQLLQRRYKDKLDSDANEFIAYAVDGAKRMQIQINDLLAYSRVTSQGHSMEATDCSAVFQNAIASLAGRIEESGAVVTQDPLPTVPADESQLTSVFQNLIGNGIKYRGEQAPQIHVSAVESGDEWVFSISDNGIGIEPQFAERIFEIFQRLHSKEEYAGTGIGLAICKKVIERHGGRIWVESEAKNGSNFRFTLPIRQEWEKVNERIG